MSSAARQEPRPTGYGIVTAKSLLRSKRKLLSACQERGIELSPLVQLTLRCDKLPDAQALLRRLVNWPDDLGAVLAGHMDVPHGCRSLAHLPRSCSVPLSLDCAIKLRTVCGRYGVRAAFRDVLPRAEDGVRGLQFIEEVDNHAISDAINGHLVP